MNYTTIEAVEKYTGISIDAGDEPSVEEYIGGISRFFDRIADRKLVADEEESGEETPDYRVYDGDGSPWLAIDDCVEIVSVEIGGDFATALAAVTDASAYPAIAPHRKLYRAAGFPCGIQNVRIAARWGYREDLPEDLKFAATVIVGGVLFAKQPGVQGKKSESIGNYSVTYSDDKGIADYERALAILEGYKRHSL
jgi:hypothetical protein